MVRVMCGGYVKGRKSAKELMPMLGLNETIYMLAMINSVCCCTHVLVRRVLMSC